MDLNELKAERAEKQQEIQKLDCRKKEIEDRITKLPKELRSAQIASRRRDGALQAQEREHALGVESEALEENLLQVQAELLDVQDDFDEVNSKICEIEAEMEAKERQGKVTAIVKANRRTFDDYHNATLRLAQLRGRDDGLRAAFKAAYLEWDAARAKGPDGFDRSIDLYDKTCATLYAKVERLERERDELRSEIIPIEHEEEALREKVNALLGNV